MPPLITSYSVATFGLGTDEELSGTVFSSSNDATEEAKLTDHDNMNTYTDSTATGCYFGMEFKDMHVAVLSEVKFFYECQIMMLM
eukprot:CAMPEP_0116874866 /NCGR_PEP_ID=MMETSP0463-20121206/6463_1 /TAXON_ID=181622 /ORGANISM="Strombidinopsis sp, Strain SopsisLIS2011" /LENGTH=84 /DNA_ID=CAMNT_0004519209 /DNA_START=484 /DNA_END=738 /DNA_ORIENTATION=-